MFERDQPPLTSARKGATPASTFRVSTSPSARERRAGPTLDIVQHGRRRDEMQGCSCRGATEPAPPYPGPAAHGVDENAVRIAGVGKGIRRCDRNFASIIVRSLRCIGIAAWSPPRSGPGRAEAIAPAGRAPVRCRRTPPWRRDEPTDDEREGRGQPCQSPAPRPAGSRYARSHLRHRSAATLSWRSQIRQPRRSVLRKGRRARACSRPNGRARWKGASLS